MLFFLSLDQTVNSTLFHWNASKSCKTKILVLLAFSLNRGNSSNIEQVWTCLQSQFSRLVQHSLLFSLTSSELSDFMWNQEITLKLMEIMHTATCLWDVANGRMLYNSAKSFLKEIKRWFITDWYQMSACGIFLLYFFSNHK